MQNALKLALEALRLAAECGGENDSETYVEAEESLREMVGKVVAYDREMDREERSPDGNDYNELLSILGLATSDSQAAICPVES